MMAMARGYMVSQTIRTTIELSIPDRLAEGPLTAAEVAERESSRHTYRLMRAASRSDWSPPIPTAGSTAHLCWIRCDAMRPARSATG
jgi:hypothetical protein